MHYMHCCWGSSHRLSLEKCGLNVLAAWRLNDLRPGEAATHPNLRSISDGDSPVLEQCSWGAFPPRISHAFEALLKESQSRGQRVLVADETRSQHVP